VPSRLPPPFSIAGQIMNLPTHPSPASTSSSAGVSFFRQIQLFVGLGLVLLAMLGYFIWAGYQQAVLLAEVSTRNLAQVIESRVSSDFSRIDSVLSYLASEYQPEALKQMPAAERAEHSRHLAQLIGNFSAIGGAFIFDADGVLQLSSDPNVKPFRITDRPHFQTLRDSPQTDVVFSDALIARSSGKWSLIYSRAIRDASGKFLGITNTSFRLDEIANLFGNIDVGPGGVTLLRRSDNFKLVQRVPRLAEKDFNQPTPQDNPVRQRIEAGDKTGTMVITASTDGVRRLISFRHLETYPFFVQIAMAESHYLADWRRQTLFSGGIAVALLAFLGFAVMRLNRANDQAAAAQQQLEESEARMEQALRGGDLGMWDWHLPSGKVIFNARWCTMLGYRPDEIEPHVSSWLKLVNPDDEAAINASINPVLSGENPGLYECEHRMRHKDGHWIWILARGIVTQRDPAGSGVRMVGTHQDITEHKRAEQELATAEEKFRTVADFTMGWEYWEGPQHELLYMSPSCEGITGYIRDDYMADPALLQRIVHPDDKAQFGVHVHTADQQQDYTLEFRIVCRDGSVRWIMHGCRPVHGDDGQYRGRRVSNRDITDRKQAEAELIRSNAELEQFSYSISHDMRQPLRMISSYLQLLQMSLDEKLDDEQRGYLHFAVDGAQRLDTMLLGLLEYSRVGRKGEPPAWVESRAVLDEALLFLQPAIAEAGAEIRIEGDWPRILASPDEILRLVQNLICNALKFRVAGRTPQIAVTSEVVGENWRLCVTDNGIGILPDQIGRLFKVFQRLQSRATYEGTGIGLALCRKIAEHQGGRIWVESEGEGKGSRFQVEIALPNEVIGNLGS